MTISYTLQPQPIWIFNDLTGRPAAGGKLFTKSSLNPTQFKEAFQDPGGNIPWTNPIVFDADGMAPGAIYWKLDTLNPDDLYYVYFEDAEGNLIWSENVYPISGSGGGGGGITIVEKIDNILTNSSFTQNIGATTVSPVANNEFLASGAHSGLIFPDIIFLRDGVASGADSVSFVPFTTDPGIGINPISPDFLSIYYMRYVCTIAGAENFKGIQIPISKYVNNLSSKLLTLTFYARHAGGVQNQLNFNVLQYFGSGGSPSSPVITPLVQPKNITGSFAFYTVNITIPTTLAKTLGNSDDDGTYLQIIYPSGGTTTIDIFKPMLWVGSDYPTTVYESNEENEVEINLPRTGDVRISMNAFSSTRPPSGWIPLDDGTIGNASSGSTTRAKPDAWLLYQMIFDNTVAADCPLFDSAGAPIAKAGTALSNWNANNRLKLPVMTDSVPANRGTGANALGHNFGAHTKVIGATNLPPHTHTTTINTNTGAGGAVGLVRGNGIGFGNINYVSDNGPGTSAPFNVDQPTTYFNMIIKL